MPGLEGTRWRSCGGSGKDPCRRSRRFGEKHPGKTQAAIYTSDSRGRRETESVPRQDSLRRRNELQGCTHNLFLVLSALLENKHHRRFEHWERVTRRKSLADSEQVNFECNFFF